MLLQGQQSPTPEHALLQQLLGMSNFKEPAETTSDTGGMFGNFNTGDMGALLQGFGQLYGAYTGNKKLGLAEEQFDYSKALSGVNLSNQANLTNSQLSDRQDRRNRDNALNMSLGGTDTGALSTADYLAKFGVQGRI